MRIASPFQRRRTSRQRRRGALGAGLLSASLSVGCFFELAEVADGLPDAGGAGSSAAGANGIGGSSTAGRGGVGVGGSNPQPCPPGQKDCGSGCVEFATSNGCNDPTCTPCAPLQQASLSCNGDTGACQLDECDSGFADCDGDTSAYDGRNAGNGCEYPFGPGGVIRSTPSLLEVPLVSNIDIGDGSRDDWDGVPAYSFAATCDNCVDDALPDVTAKNEVPSRRDLDAYFRVAWNQDFFYVLGDVFDGSLFANGADSDDGRCQNGALCEDALTVFFDGRNDRAVQTGYGSDDTRTFLGLGSKAYRVSGQQVTPDQVDFKVTVNGPACYRIEAQFSWAFVVGVQNNPQEVVDQFPPKNDNQYGFDISINDWDPGVSDQTPRRESQLFWVNPGDGYQRLTSGFGPMRLTEQVPPEPQGTE